NSPPASARSPKELMVAAARGAAMDSGASDLLKAIDGVTVVRQFSDTLPRFASPFGRMENPPWSVARALGCNPRELLYTTAGGHTPQVVVTRFCEEIAAGRLSCALMVGAEALRTQHAAQKNGTDLDWSEAAPTPPESFGVERASFSDLEGKYGLNAAIYGYPIVEQAIRRQRQLSPSVHAHRMGALMARLAEVASSNPLATRRTPLTAAEIASVSEKNPYIGYPYTRYMNANVFVDQSAAILVCSAKMADDYGVPDAKRVYLHGAAAGNDHWYVTEREPMQRSPAIREVVRRTLSRAGVGVEQVSFFDLYSCFPSAIEIACAEIGLSEDDPRNFTITGGLPFFGGPGNNYVTHSIAAMVEKLRSSPTAYGLVTANGSYLAKHAAGLYSARMLEGPWDHTNSQGLQAQLNAVPMAPLIDGAGGAASIESYTLAVRANVVEKAIIVGRLRDGNQRFLANIENDDQALLQSFIESDRLGAEGTVRTIDGKCRFAL
ncbi:hypothetical protein, partial [Rhodopseudomonas palustris]